MVDDLAVGRSERGELSGAQRAVGQALEHRLQEGVDAERGSGVGQRDDPVFVGRGAAAQLDQRAIGGDAHLHGVVLAEAGVGVERLVGVVGARRRRHQIDDHVGGRPSTEHHAVAVGRAIEVLVIGAARRRAGPARRQRARVAGEARADFVAAGGRRRIGPRAEVGRVEHEGLGLRVVVGDAAGLTGARAVDHRDELVRELDRAVVLVVARQRNDQLVLQPAPDARVEELREELVVGDDRGHAYPVGARQGRHRDVVLEERVEARHAADVDRPRRAGRVLRRGDRRRGGVARIGNQLEPGADGVVHGLERRDQHVHRPRLEHREDVEDRVEADEHRFVVRKHALVAGEDLEAAAHQARVVDVEHRVHRAAALGAEDDRVDAVRCRAVLVVDADLRADGDRVVPGAVARDLRREAGRHGVQVALAHARALVQRRHDVLDDLAVQHHGERVAGRHSLEVAGEVDHHLDVVSGMLVVADLRRGRLVVRLHARPLQRTERRQAATARNDDDRAIHLRRGGRDARLRSDGGGEELRDARRAREVGADDLGHSDAVQRERPRVALVERARVAGEIGLHDHLPGKHDAAADRCAARDWTSRQRCRRDGEGAVIRPVDIELAVRDKGAIHAAEIGIAGQAIQHVTDRV